MVSQPTLGTVVNNALPGVISVIMIHFTLIHTLVMLCSPMRHFRPHLDTSHQVGTFVDYKNVLSGKKQKYHSHRFVNESVLLLAHFVRETTRLFLNRCKFVSIIIDEETDISVKGQLIVYFRCVEPITGTIHIIFAGIYELTTGCSANDICAHVN